MDMDTLLCLTWRTSKDLLDSTGNSAQYSVITLWSPGGRMGEGIVRESGMGIDTLLYLTWRTSKDLLDSTGNSAQCHVAAWMGGEFGGERASLVAQMVKHLPAIRETRVRSLGREDLLEKEMATHSSIPAWRIPGMEEPGKARKELDTTEQLHFASYI